MINRKFIITFIAFILLIVDAAFFFKDELKPYYKNIILYKTLILEILIFIILISIILYPFFRFLIIKFKENYRKNINNSTKKDNLTDIPKYKFLFYGLVILITYFGTLIFLDKNHEILSFLTFMSAGFIIFLIIASFNDYIDNKELTLKKEINKINRNVTLWTACIVFLFSIYPFIAIKLINILTQEKSGKIEYLFVISISILLLSFLLFMISRRTKSQIKLEFLLHKYRYLEFKQNNTINDKDLDDVMKENPTDTIFSKKNDETIIKSVIQILNIFKNKKGE